MEERRETGLEWKCKEKGKNSGRKYRARNNGGVMKGEQREMVLLRE